MLRYLLQRELDLVAGVAVAVEAGVEVGVGVGVGVGDAARAWWGHNSISAGVEAPLLSSVSVTHIDTLI